MATPTSKAQAPKSKGFSMNDVQNLRQRFRQHQENSGAVLKKTGSRRKRNEPKASTVDEPTEFEKVGAANRPAFTKIRKNKAAFEGMKAVNEMKKEETKKNLSVRKTPENKKSSSLRKDRESERDKDKEKVKFVPKKFVRAPATSPSTSSGSTSGKAAIIAPPKATNHSARKTSSKGKSKSGSKRRTKSKKTRGSAESLPPPSNRCDPSEEPSSVFAEADEFDLSRPGAHLLLNGKATPKKIVKAVEADSLLSSPASPIASTPPYARQEENAQEELSCFVEPNGRKSQEATESKSRELLTDEPNRSTSTMSSSIQTFEDDAMNTEESSLDCTTSDEGTSTTSRSTASDSEEKLSSPSLDVIAASLHIVDHCVEKNLFAEFMEPMELESFNDFFTGQQEVNEHILVIIDKAFDRMLSSETMAKSEETQRDLAVLNRDKNDSKTHLLDALIAKKAIVNLANDGAKNKEKRDDSDEAQM